MMYYEYMAKDEAITIRLPAVLKRRLEKRARRYRRSLSSQVVDDLEAVLDADVRSSSGKFLGLYSGSTLPTDDDIKEVRLLLWGSLGKRDWHHD